MVEISVNRLIAGDDRMTSRRYSRVAVVLTVLFFGAFVFVSQIEWFTLPVRWYLGVIAVMLIFAGLQAYSNRSLLVSVLLAVGPALGYYLSLSLFRLGGPSPSSVPEAFGLALLFGLLIGVVGYVVGRTLRSMVDK
jgi:hypothetical protein